jgi:hypothetical protein
MHLKAKLCILKNYTPFLLGPSPFEHWLESYKYVTVRPLCFLLFATESPIVFPEPPISSTPLRARVAPAAGHPRAPVALRLAPRVARSLLPPPALPSLAVPRSSTSGRRPERLPRRPVGHAGAARCSVLGRVMSLSLSVSSANRCAATKPDRAPSPRLLCLFFLAATPSRRRSSSPGFSSTTPPRPNSLCLSLPHLLP